MLDHLYNKLHKAESDFKNAKDLVSRLNVEIRAAETDLLERLTVGRNLPCKAAILPDGKIAVHVWVESSGFATRLHIVEPVELEKP